MIGDFELVFMGEFEVAVDEKNRVMIPSKWRTELDKQIVVSEGFDGAIEIRTKSTFQEYYRKLSKNNSYSRDVRILRRKILGTAHELTLDKWFRFVIPQSLNKGYKASVLMRGNGDSIEVWDKEVYRRWSESEENTLEAAAESIAGSPEDF